MVIHAIAPTKDEEEDLILCYKHSLELTLVHNIKSIVRPQWYCSYVVIISQINTINYQWAYTVKVIISV